MMSLLINWLADRASVITFSSSFYLFALWSPLHVTIICNVIFYKRINSLIFYLMDQNVYLKLGYKKHTSHTG
jgi:hypothetical protein